MTVRTNIAGNTGLYSILQCTKLPTVFFVAYYVHLKAEPMKLKPLKVFHISLQKSLQNVYGIYEKKNPATAYRKLYFGID
jgi:hypothetical protein